MKGKRTRLKRAIKVRRKNLKDRRAARAEKKANSRRVTKVDGRRSSAPGKPSFVRFAASSFTCTVVDQALAWFLFAALRRPFAGAGFIRILVSNVLARCVSLSLNFVLNRRLVFVPDEDGRRPRKRESLPKFIALAAVVLTLSSIGVFCAHEYLGVEEWQAKLVVDFVLFFFNYYGQRKWVFRNDVTVRMPRSH